MRRRDSFLNILTGIGSQVVLIIFGLISRKIFINILGLEILGINGLLSNIISMLSLAELGIGAAIYYSLYKPLANEDYTQVRAIMDLYAKLYKYIALAVACIGIAIIPFLNLIVKDNINNSYLIGVYLCFLADAVLSYVLAYKKNIISADQKSYIINAIQTCFSIAVSIAQIIILITTHSFILFLLVKIILGVSTNVVFHFIANKMYPYLKNKDKVELNPVIKVEIIKNAKALFISNVAVYCVIGTDNILISIFVNITAVGLYSNYVLIINIIKGLETQIFVGVMSSYGNLLIKESLESSHNVFTIIHFLNFWIASFCSVCLFILLNPFINLWLGGKELLPLFTVAMMIMNFYFQSSKMAIETVRNASGLYSPYPFFKYWSLVEGIVNLILCLVFAGLLEMGMVGILLATTVSTQITLLVLPWNVYKYVFKKSSKPYFKKNFIYLIYMILITTLTLWISSITITNGLTGLLIKVIICLALPNLIIIALFYKTREFQYIWNIKKIIIRKLLK